MTTKLVQHLARCTVDLLIPLLGDATITLLKRVGNDALNPEGLAYLVVSMLGEEGALRNSTIRNLLFLELDNEEGKALCELLQLPTSAALMTLNSADFDVNLSNLEMLTRWFGVPYDASDLATREIEGSRKAMASHKLRSHQLIAFRKLRSIISNSAASALIHMPFGAGKLRLVVTAVLDLYRSEPDGKVILWLTPGEALCDEAFTELRKVWEQLGSRDVTIYRYYGSRAIPDFGSLENCIIVADITKIRSDHAGLIELGQKTRVVVLGDAEHVGHPVGAEILDVLSRKADFSLVGISASPGSVMTANPYSPALKKRFAGSCITIDDNDPILLLREAGDIGELIVEIQPATWAVASVVHQDSLDFNFEQIEGFSKDVERNHALLDLLLGESKAASRIVFFATTAEDARLFAGLLALRGVRAMSVTSDKSPEERALVIQKFNARKEQILCVHGFFVSGDLVPEMTLAIIACPTLSESVFHGMVGRLASTRSVEQNYLKIVVVADSIPERACPKGTLESWNKLNI